MQSNAVYSDSYRNKAGAVQSVINITYPVELHPASDDALKVALAEEKEQSKSKKPLKNEIYISNEVKMPLKVRKFETGDFFYPYGMIGKKKVSKFFKDEKLSIFDKQNKWILTDANNQIIWIIGMRVDRRLIKTDGECLKISI